MNGFQVLIPHPLCDPTEFGSLADLYGIYGRDGYLGGLRLLQVTKSSSITFVDQL
jgi:glucuronokinase